MFAEQLEVRNLLSDVPFSTDSVWAGDTFTAYGISIVDNELSWEHIEYHDGGSGAGQPVNPPGNQEGEGWSETAQLSASLPSPPGLIFSPLPDGGWNQFAAYSLGYDAVIGPSGASLSWSDSPTAAGSADLLIELVGANAQANPIESLPGPTGEVYAITYDDVYAGIDVVYYGRGQQLEFDFVIEPGADPDQIEVRYVGLDEIYVNAGGNLVLDGPHGELWQEPLLVFQEVNGERLEINAAYQLEGDIVRFELDDYNSALPLIIDPVVGGPDPGVPGPLAVTTRPFDLGEEVFVPPDFAAAWAATPPTAPGAPQTAPAVEMRGVVYHPTNLAGPHPLVVFMHGRHATAFDPTTNAPFLEWPVAAGHQEIPSYDGYAFIGQLLASHGYIVVSIGANGINAHDQDLGADTSSVTDGGMQARAELFVEHLTMWQDCNSAVGCTAFGTDFTGQVDLNNVGLMGHSRGGEGVMRAILYNESLGSPFGINAGFLLAPTNFARDVVDAVPFAVVLPYADGDVSDLQGVHYFDDSQYNLAGDPDPMFYFHVMGANHNYYNTVWTPNNGYPANDDGAFYAGLARLTDAEQRGTAEAYLTGFFRTYLGDEVEFEPMLKGDFYPPPSAMTQEIYPTYQAPENTASALNLNRLFDNADLNTNDVGGAVRQNPASPLAPYALCGGPAPQPQSCIENQPSAHEPHTSSSIFSNSPGLSQLQLGWNNAEAFWANDIPAGNGDVSAYEAFQVRVGVDYSDARNAVGVAPGFTIRIIDGGGNQADAIVGNSTNAVFFPPGVTGDPRGTNDFTLPRMTLNAVRIPLSAFSGVNLADVTSIEFLFNQQPTGALFLSDLALVDQGTNLPGPGPGGSISIAGSKYLDEDGDGLRDPRERGLAGVYIYVDLDGDGRLSLGEPVVITGEFGDFSLPPLVPGNYTIRELPAPGYLLTEPVAGSHLVTIDADLTVRLGTEPVLTLSFGNMPAYDYGDVPAPYASLKADNGPVHGLLAGFHLGASVDPEDDGFQDPDNLSASDDNTGADDEDGVVFTTPLAPGSLSELEVSVSTGNTSPGSLNAWIDFNGNGSFSDPGERIITNAVLGSGVYTLPFNVPINAVPGLTYSRFRFSHQAGLAPTGPALDGEVEDHQVAILDADAQAIDDAFVVYLNSQDNELDVLANDLPGLDAFGRDVRLLAPLGPTSNGGEARIDNRGTLTNFSDDVVVYTPAPGYLGEETFTYLMIDAAGNFDQATVTVNIEFPPVPLAIDDHFRVDRNATNRTLDVLANDVIGENGPLTIVNVSGASHGTVGLIDGNTRLSYTPAAGYEGSDRFVYTVRDVVGETDTATVTVDIGDSTFDDLVRFSFLPTDLSGIPLASNEVTLGEEFKVQVYIEDIRDITNNNPPLPMDMGVFSAYLDLLYTSRYLSVTGVSYGSVYTAARSGNAGLPGIVDELGAFRGGIGSGSVTQPIGPDPQLLAELSFVASHVGLARIDGDPADILPLHETLLHQDADDPTEALFVEYQQMQFVPATVRINPASDMAAVVLRTTDLNGNPIDSIDVGDVFKLQVLADDLRLPPTLDRGVYALYTDIVFDSDRVEYAGAGANPVLSSIRFVDPYGSGVNAILRAGEIDEAGAFVEGANPSPVGPDPVLVFEVLLSATRAGDITFRSNPADDGEIHDIVLQRPGDGVTVPASLVQYESITITAAPGEPEMAFTNPLNPLDVNDDRQVTPIDALLLVNALNKTGPHLLTAADGEEATTGRFPDVDNNGMLEPRDVLQVINYLNGLNNGSGEGEASAALLPAESESNQRDESPAVKQIGAEQAGRVDAVMAIAARRLDAAFSSNSARTGADDLESLLDDALAGQVLKDWLSQS